MTNPAFRIRSIRLEGAGGEIEYTFSRGVNLVVGAVGTGKSSLLELVKYGIGGNGVLSGAVQAGVTSLAVGAEIGAYHYVLRRRIDDREVEIRSGTTGALLERAHVSGTRDLRNVSDVLLDLCGLPHLQVPRRRSRPTADLNSITFFDVFAYMYARQIEIDRSVVNHLDGLRDPKRRATFEMLYGFLNEEMAAIQRQIGTLTTALEDGVRRNRNIEAFLVAFDERGEDALRIELDRQALAARAAAEAVHALRQGILDRTPRVDELRAELASTELSLGEARSELAQSTSTAARMEALIAQLELDEQRINRSVVAGGVLAPFRFVVCPRCQQSVVDLHSEPGDCDLCGQPELPADQSERLVRERARIANQLGETARLREAAAASAAAAGRRVHELELRIAELRDRVNRLTAEFVSPLMSEIEAASSEQERVAAARLGIERSLALWRQHREGEAEVALIRQRIEGLGRDLEAARSVEQGAVERVRALSELLEETLRGFRYPWYESAEIDRQSYLPIVNGEPFDLASGGMKTLINVAYHLAGLRYGLRYRDSRLPLFLMLDSPRKNLGAENVDDRLIGSEVYRRLWSIQGANPDDFQMIVADNDLPSNAEGFNLIRLDYEHPLIPWVTHPGPDEVVSIN